MRLLLGSTIVLAVLLIAQSATDSAVAGYACMALTVAVVVMLGEFGPGGGNG